MPGFQIRNISPQDRDAVSRLIFHSTNRYYESIGREPIFRGSELSTSVFYDVYDRIDGDAALVAVDDDSGGIVGSCFVHPRETHVSLGIMNVHPDQFGRGIARGLLGRILELAQARSAPVRLVSSCFNLDSFSLYTRAGFAAFCTYQDMYLQVPAEGLADPPSDGFSVRDATPDDVDAMSRLERDISGISRAGDYRYFVDNEQGFWHVSVIESNRPGELDGFLVSCGAEALNMLGPGVSRTQAQAAALMRAELNQHRGRMPVFLVPVDCRELVQRLYSWGARNCEMHVAQAFGEASAPRGVTMPTFLPETG